MYNFVHRSLSLDHIHSSISPVYISRLCSVLLGIPSSLYYDTLRYVTLRLVKGEQAAVLWSVAIVRWTGGSWRKFRETTDQFGSTLVVFCWCRRLGAPRRLASRSGYCHRKLDHRLMVCEMVCFRRHRE